MNKWCAYYFLILRSKRTNVIHWAHLVVVILFLFYLPVHSFAYSLWSVLYVVICYRILSWYILFVFRTFSIHHFETTLTRSKMFRIKISQIRHVQTVQGARCEFRTRVDFRKEDGLNNVVGWTQANRQRSWIRGLTLWECDTESGWCTTTQNDQIGCCCSCQCNAKRLTDFIPYCFCFSKH